MLGSPTITVKGRNLLAKIVAAKIPLTLSNIGLGDGLQEETEEVISLSNEIMKKEIESCNYNEKEGQYYIKRIFTNAELEEGFYIREVGIYAIDPDEGEILYAYTNAGETGVDYFAPGKGKVIVKEIIEMATKFGNAENITVLIDPSVALATKEDINNLQKQIDEHKEEYTELKEDVDQLSNPNLLINGDFQVWQRGERFRGINGVVYTADRWIANNGVCDGIEVSKHGNGLKMKCLTSCAGVIKYNIENKSRFIGKPITLTVCIDNTVYKHTCTLNNVNEFINFDIGNKNFTIGTSVNSETPLIVYIGKNLITDEIVIFNYVKLELGSVATPFYPRSYGEELALCQRYYNPDFRCKGVPCGSSSNNIYINESFPITMRVTPTCTIINSKMFDIEAYGNVVFTQSSINIFASFINNIMSSDNNLVPGHHYALSLVLDAEIY